MNKDFNEIDAIVNSLREYKRRLGEAIVDDKESVVSLTNKLDKVIKELEEGNASMKNSKSMMDYNKGNRWS